MSEQHDQDDTAAGFSPAGMVVLVVDDDKLCLKVIAKMLTQCHYEGLSFTHLRSRWRLPEGRCGASFVLVSTQLFKACAL